MPSPIETMIDRGMKCTRCSAPMGKCDCWEKNVLLHCPSCKRGKMVCKDPSDPPGTRVVESQCDKCGNGGDRPEVHYYDAQGRWFDGEGFRAVGQGSGGL